MREASWQRGLRGVVGIFAFGLFVGLAPSAVMAQAVCGNGIVEGGGTEVCVGDCNDSGDVTVDEIVTMVNAALQGGVGGCPNGDGNMDGSITVDEIVSAVNNALNGCMPPPGRTCGNGTTDTGEDCDNGGVCIGGTNAGTTCNGEGDCQGNGICE